MLDERMLKEVILSQKKTFIEKNGLFKRAVMADFYEKNHKLKEAIIITGIRRAGKSSLLKLIWDEFKKKENLSEEQFLYVNFEDERLSDFNKDDFERMMMAYYEMNKPDKKKKIILFLDEIQNIKYWEKWVNRMREAGRYRIFITGSNATLLSSELSSSLTGRHVAITLYPLSFYEYYCFFKGNVLTKKSLYDRDEMVKIKKALAEYLKLGGMPEYLKTSSLELIQEYFRDILQRDIVNRYNIKYKRGLNELAHFLLSNIGQIASLRNLSKAIEIKNINTIKNYLQYLEDSYLFFRASLFSNSYKQQIYNPDKIYAADLAFFNNIAFRTSENNGAVYENAVFLHFLNSGAEVYYYKTKNNLEVDFAVKTGNKVQELIQVAYSLENETTIAREEKALLSAMEELNINRGVIINMSKEEEKDIKIKGSKKKKIIYIPAWKWLLGTKI